MSLKLRVGLLIALLFGISGATSIAVDQLVIRPSFLELEQLEAERNTGRAVEAIHHELNVLSTNLIGWAWSNEAQTFMSNANASFIERALSPELVAMAQLSYIGFYRSDGTQVVHRAAPPTSDAYQGLGRLQGKSLPRDHPLLKLATDQDVAKGLMSTASGPMLVASRPILSSRGEGPRAGVLIIGRLLDSATIDRIADRFKLDLSVSSAASAAPNDSAHGPPADWQPGEPRRATNVHVDPDGQSLTGETTMADMHGDPILALSVKTSRAISIRGEKASRIAQATLGVVSLIVLSALILLMHVTVLGPIAKLTAHAVSLGRDEELRSRIDLTRSDEIGVLATEFDRMTDRLAEVRERLVDQSFVSGKADMAAGILHNLGNAVTPIAVRINLMRDRLKSSVATDVEHATLELEAGTAPPERHADLSRFVRLAAAEDAALFQTIEADLANAALQIEHVQQILGEQEQYSRAGAMGEAIDIVQIVRWVADGFQPQVQRAVVFEIHSDATEDERVFAPRVLVQQIVGNLILNAVESIQAHRMSGGRVVVTNTVEESDHTRFSHITIFDNGGGIEGASVSRIFDSRYSTKQRGSGLGLHWCANTVASLGGKLFAESQGVGLGATLHLLLPLKPGAAEDVVATNRREAL